eukprot:TRINITY_DN24209_c0_g1_i1.p1 TRINITY_DN24209_c0_g1~~TRINITY_DN24209_c0_g1_i1.p1  ORF type:complete len:384 (+),score=44.18 TRINITY_DN24209_c0_g1_i1:135-1286(+)
MIIDIEDNEGDVEFAPRELAKPRLAWGDPFEDSFRADVGTGERENGGASPLDTRRSRSASLGDIWKPGAVRASIAAHALPLGLPLIRLSKPVFVPLQIFVPLILVVFFQGDRESPVFGLEKCFPGRTTLRLTLDCTDQRFEVWRWFSYQFSHTSYQHVTMNGLLVLLALPEERFQGSLKLFFMFNVGIMGGACVVMLFDVHSSVVGMSAGAYAVVGVQFADFIMNFDVKEYPVVELLFFLSALAVGVAETYVMWEENVSHACHLGGFISGLLACLAFGRVIIHTPAKRTIRRCVAALMLFLVVFCLSWNCQWPPRNIWDANHPWCWHRQVSNRSIFQDEGLWHCVRCQALDCASEWSKQQWVERVSEAACARELGGWSDRTHP